jgi:MYXO-CTERM domain-containing protein
LISTVDDRFTANVYQVGHYVYGVNATTVGSHAGISWYKMDTNSNQVVQQGTFSNSAFDYFQPSMAANANGNIVITFTRSGSGPGGNLSLYAVVARTDANGVVSFGTPFLLQAGTVSNYSFDNGRWGDYATTVVDPLNPNVFWTFQEYADSSSTWATQIIEISVPEPDSIALAAVALGALGLYAWRRRRSVRAAEKA